MRQKTGGSSEWGWDSPLLCIPERMTTQRFNQQRRWPDAEMGLLGPREKGGDLALRPP